MKQLTNKIAAIILAFVVFFSTMSFTIDMHFCGDTLVETAIFYKAKGCGMETQNANSKNCETIQKNCCSDEQILVQGQDELQKSFENFSIEQPLFALSFANSYLNTIEEIKTNNYGFEEYAPPLVKKDFNILYRVFRI